MTTLYTAAILRALVISALEAAVSTGGLVSRVRSPGDERTAEQELPCVIVRTGRQRKEQNTPGALNFRSTIEILVTAQLETALSGEAAQDTAETTAFAIESALFTYAPLLRQVQQWSYVDEQITIVSDGGKHHAQIDFAFAMTVFEFVQPQGGQPLTLNPVVPRSGGS